MTNAVVGDECYLYYMHSAESACFARKACDAQRSLKMPQQHPHTHLHNRSGTGNRHSAKWASNDWCEHSTRCRARFAIACRSTACILYTDVINCLQSRCDGLLAAVHEVGTHSSMPAHNLTNSSKEHMSVHRLIVSGPEILLKALEMLLKSSVQVIKASGERKNSTRSFSVWL